MRTLFSRIALFLVLGASLSSADAQLYKWVDKDGKITYSDTPPPKDAKETKQKNFTDNVSATVDDLPYAVRDAIKRNPVTLFANACGELCDSARQLLATRGIPFADRNPEKDPAALDALKAATGDQSVPALTIGTRVLRGFAESEWNDALTSSGYPRSNPGIKPATPTPAPATGTPAAPPPAPASVPGK